MGYFSESMIARGSFPEAPLDEPDPDFKCCECGTKDEDGGPFGEYDDWYCADCLAEHKRQAAEEERSDDD